MLRRRLTASGLPVLLLAAMLGVWGWSFARPFHVAFTSHGKQLRAWLASGRMGVDNEPEVAAASVQRQQDLKALESFATGNDLLVAPPSKVPVSWSRSSALALPLLMALLAMVLLLPMVVRRVTHRLRATAHRCVACGYSLTGNVSGVCPECGMPAGR